MGTARYAGPERRSTAADSDELIPVRLTRKYAEAIDGIDLSHCEVGDRLPLPERAAALLLAEGWADQVPARGRRTADRRRGRGKTR